MTIDIVDFPINSMVIFNSKLLNYQRVTPKKMSRRFFWSRFSSRDRRIWSFLDWRGKCTDSNPVLGWNFGNLPIAQEEMRPSTGKKITVAKPWKKSSKFQCISRWQIMSLVNIHAGWWFGTFGLFFHILGMSSQQTNSIIFQRGRAQPPTRIGSKSVLSNLYLICNIARLDKVESTLWAFHRSQRSQPGRSLHWPSFWYTRKNISQSLSLAIFEWLRVDMYIHIHIIYI